MKNENGEIFKVVSNFSEKDKIFVQLEKVEAVIPPDELLKEI